MADLYTPSLDRATDGNGNPISGAKMYFFLTETTTPQDAYTDGAELVVASNPVVADAEGMFDPVFLAPGINYRVRLTNATGSVVYYDVDPVAGTSVGGGETYLVLLTFIGTPPAQGFMGGHKFLDTVTFPINFAGALGSVESDPATDFVISVRKNDVEIGTVTISSAGAFTFATSGGNTVTFSPGDKLTFIAPDSAGTAADFAVTFEGAVE